MGICVYEREMIQNTERMLYCLKMRIWNVGRLGKGLVQEESDLSSDWLFSLVSGL